MSHHAPAEAPRCIFRRVEFETIKVKIDSRDAGAIRWDRKRGWLPDAQLEETLGVSLPAEAMIDNSHNACDYVRAAATLIPPPQEGTARMWWEYIDEHYHNGHYRIESQTTGSQWEYKPARDEYFPTALAFAFELGFEAVEYDGQTYHKEENTHEPS